MKNILYLAIFLLNFSVYAQPPGGGGGQRGERQNQQGQQDREKPRVFKSAEVAGLFSYDVEKIIKKLKIKDETLETSVAKLLKDYNFEIKEITLLNADKFKDFDKLVNAEMQARRESGNQRTKNNTKGELREKIQEVLRPIRKEVREKEEKLNENLEAVLSKKQNKKWLKYQKKLKDKLKPKRAQRNNNQQPGQRGNRQRGGF
ncbi:hypothetical protein [Polaribacter porphyrae]|uniref:DUF4296 domain-containing protein n=1 Tax=Polaribacter porphyrae TaxID=1137780 RepID=A0A2S7WK37_9FLAO|nr:hypothetical protein [Polaribacter porphyrae]PQJ77975.1 hypothetical protein BTO18_01685 [Polaribacter porphyrae]